MAQEGPWNFAREECCRTEVRCLRKNVTLSENTKATHEENFLSSWLKEDGKDKERCRLTGRLTKK